MPLIPLMPLFHSFNREYFDGSLVKGARAIVNVRWSDRRLRKTAGLYRRVRKGIFRTDSEIVLSQPLLQRLPRAATESTLCHEMIHAWIDLVLQVEESHGPRFHKKMHSINSLQDNFLLTVRHNFPVPKPAQKWWAICPSCSVKYPYQRRVDGAACRQCCNAYHQGKWHIDCLLEFKPCLKEI